jgi:hypothetical protein
VRLQRRISYQIFLCLSSIKTGRLASLKLNYAWGGIHIGLTHHIIFAALYSKNSFWLFPPLPMSRSRFSSFLFTSPTRRGGGDRYNEKTNRSNLKKTKKKLT